MGRGCASVRWRQSIVEPLWMTARKRGGIGGVQLLFRSRSLAGNPRLHPALSEIHRIATPSHREAYSYDCLNLIAQAIRQVGFERGALREYLNSLGKSRPPYRGVSGEFSPSLQAGDAPCLHSGNARGKASGAALRGLRGSTSCVFCRCHRGRGRFGRLCRRPGSASLAVGRWRRILGT